MQKRQASQVWLYWVMILGLLFLRDKKHKPILDAPPSPQGLTEGPLTQTLKIAMGAFYAICLQRAFETAIMVLRDAPPIIPFLHDTPWRVTSAEVLVALQLPAFMIWLTLYYIENVRIYFRIRETNAVRRILVHGVLSLTLAIFYFFGATVGSPGLNQLILILGIVALDALYPLLVGSVLSPRRRMVWFSRGVGQTVLLAVFIAIVPRSSYVDPIWSGLLLGLVLVQLVIGVPLDHRLQARSEEGL